jgi:hypothetical protein
MGQASNVRRHFDMMAGDTTVRLCEPIMNQVAFTESLSHYGFGVGVTGGAVVYTSLA